MKTIVCTFAVLFALASPASAQMHGGGHAGGGHMGGMGGFHGGHGAGGAGFHGGFVGEGERHFRHAGGFWRGGVWNAYPYCLPWQMAEGLCY